MAKEKTPEVKEVDEDANYYTIQHHLMFDSGDPEQDTLAFCRDEATAKDLAEAMNRLDKIDQEKDNLPALGVEVVQYDELIPDELVEASFSCQDMIAMIRGKIIKRNGFTYLFGDNEFWRRRKA